MAIASTIRTLLERLRPNSLAARLILAAAVWAMIALAAGGYVLSHAFVSAMRDNFDTQLQVDLDNLVAAVDVDGRGSITLRDQVLKGRFARVYSGLYWQIVPADSTPVMTSKSLFDWSLHPVNFEHRQGLIWGFDDGPLGQHLRVLGQHVSYPITATANPKDARAYTFLVAGDLSSVDAAVTEFNSTLFWSFTAMFFGLVVAVLLQVRVGLQPLRRVQEALARIRSGAAQRLEGRFPREIAPLAGELNSLIEHSQEVVGRARAHVSNLAHFLKTPLTVLAAEADAAPGPLAETVRKQVGVMRRQVDHYLTRARTAGALNVLGNRTPVGPVLEDLARVLRRIHDERGIEITVSSPDLVYFRGERQDLEEMAGNLIDNACKWAKSKVTVEVARLPDHRFQLVVGDDGPGLAPSDRNRVMTRGERLDESVPGSGLGLSIVRDIAKLYLGGLELGESPLGGLSTVLTLPALG